MSIFEFLLPDIGEGTAEGEIVKWHVKVGDQVKEDDPMVEIMTDKATVVIPSPKNGKVIKLFGKEGEIMPVHQPLLSIEIGEVDNVDKSSPMQEEATMEMNHFAPLVDKSSADSNHLYDFMLPDIGEGTAEGEVVKWHVKEGDIIKEDDPMVEVMTDKASVVIPSPKNGVVEKLFYKEGDIAKVHSVLLSIRVSGVGKVASKIAQNTTVNEPKTPQTVLVLNEAIEILATPAVRKLARDLQVDLSKVSATGKHGHITLEDVKSYTGTVGSGGFKTEKHVDDLTPKITSSRLVEEIPFAGIRRKIAEKMVHSKFTAPHFTYMDEIDVTELVALREKLKPLAEAEGIKLTYMPFMLKALVEALKRHPICNATLNTQKNVIEIKKYYNIGIGMDTPTGLIVAVLKDLDKKSIFEIAKELKDLGDRTKKGQIKPDELKDSTFTISNVGAIGGLMATPIINFPEVAIMAPGKIQQRPMVINGHIVPRWMMYHSWSCDHRIVDGADAVRCGNDFGKFLSQPEVLLVNLR